jgi:hypothetical protein
MPRPAPADAQPARSHGQLIIPNALLATSTMDRVLQAVITQLASLEGTQVEVSIEIQARRPDGIPAEVVQRVDEGCRALQFRTHGFERA